MKTIKILTWIFAVGILTTSCIERYFPDSETNFIRKLVITGSISADDGDQEIVISESSSPEMPVFSPISGCKVFVEDKKGNRLPFSESAEAGHYIGKFEGPQIIVGSHYRLSVKTPSGKQMLSKYEELMPCKAVDSVYYELQSNPTTNPDTREYGLQFYIDFKGNQNYGNFFRWQLVETYEYHSTWPLDKYLDVNNKFQDLVVLDYSHFICYKTNILGNIFILSTDGYTQNSYPKYRLHFVNDLTQRLQHKYSLLVRQTSLTKSAYSYWENLRKNNQESVDLFGRQPANVKGNIYNLNDTTDVALGYFSVSTIRTKRIIMSSVQGLKFDKVYHCKALVIDGPLTDERPLYFATDYDGYGVQYLGIAGAECIFCEMLGGTTEKPPYWDELTK